METKALLKLSLITALISLFIIVILADTIEPNLTEIREINEHRIDEWVKVRGNVTKQRSIEGLTILTIYDGTAGINAITRRKIENLKNLNVTIIGKIIDYKGELEIEVSEIKVDSK